LLFQKADKHIAIIEALSNKSKRLTREEIVVLTHISNGGVV
jgi:uncharacterized protein